VKQKNIKLKETRLLKTRKDQFMFIPSKKKETFSTLSKK